VTEADSEAETVLVEDEPSEDRDEDDCAASSLSTLVDPEEEEDLCTASDGEAETSPSASPPKPRRHSAPECYKPVSPTRALCRGLVAARRSQLLIARRSTSGPVSTRNIQQGIVSERRRQLSGSDVHSKFDASHP